MPLQLDRDVWLPVTCNFYEAHLPRSCWPAGMTLLLSLRCMALVFEEVRNLALGLAARGVDWATLGPFGGIKVRSVHFAKSSLLPSPLLSYTPLVTTGTPAGALRIFQTGILCLQSGW